MKWNTTKFLHEVGTGINETMPKRDSEDDDDDDDDDNDNDDGDDDNDDDDDEDDDDDDDGGGKRQLWFDWTSIDLCCSPG